MVQKAGTIIFAPEAVAKTVTTATVIRNGETRMAGDWKIEAVPMYNLKRGPSEGRGSRARLQAQDGLSLPLSWFGPEGL